ncbi:MAG: hypothetical protein WC804_18035 [Sphingomonas sp.]|jgi:hypothetical protein|uniref:hypothetical protein n=1 Tax=Sphingomonas sp. TaxID=28214 RepID=UPI0035671CDF
MEPLFYVMAIMGCGDGSDQCAQARVEPVHYRSIRACQVAMPAALQRNSDLSFPVISAACRASGQLLTQRQGSAHRRG